MPQARLDPAKPKSKLLSGACCDLHAQEVSRSACTIHHHGAIGFSTRAHMPHLSKNGGLMNSFAHGTFWIARCEWHCILKDLRRNGDSDLGFDVDCSRKTLAELCLQDSEGRCHDIV